MVARQQIVAGTWLACFRRIAERQRALERDATAEQVGAGGDVTLTLDRLAEEVVLDEVARICGVDWSVTVVSEECGAVEVGDGEPTGLTLVVDPVDGSNNASRGVPAHALSIAVADGDSFADVRLAYVQELGTGAELLAPSRPLSLARHEPMIALEYLNPELVAAAAGSLRCDLLRVVGSSTIALSYVGLGRFDGFVSGWGSRCVDIAAAARIASAGGATVALRRHREGGDFDLANRFQVTAARDPALLERLLGLHEGEPTTVIPPG